MADSMVLNRRTFLGNSALGLAAIACGTTLAAAPGGKWRAAIIGHTGKGNYGHEHDLIFNNRDNVEVVAIADPDVAGRQKAAERSHAARQYDDYREMLAKEKPGLVCIASRWTDQHHAMAMAALGAGAHLYMEKPFMQTLVEADEVLAYAEKTKRRIAVAHQMRIAPSMQHLKKAIETGVLGELQQIHGFGKQDGRSGGEDMIVLGTHLFDLMRLLAGDVAWCTARVLQKGHDITLADAHPATEGIGLIAGDDVYAQFGFQNGAIGTFTSNAKLRQNLTPWGIELIGSKATARILAEVYPTVYIRKQPQPWTPEGRNDQWQRLEGDPGAKASAEERAFVPSNARVVDDWLNAIEHDREPVCSGRHGMKTLEMALAVFDAGLSRARVPLPLTKRTHPLAG
jgi:predicted dehydrogenase